MACTRPPHFRAGACHKAAWACALSLTAPAGAAWAQATGPGLRVTPVFSADTTYIHSSGASSTINSGDDLVTRLSPGVQITSRSGRVQGTLDYRLTALHHTGRTGGLSRTNGGEPDIQNDLSAAGTAELVENRLFVDASANIAQTAESPYGVQSFDNTSNNGNRVEVATVRVAPRLVGNVGSVATYTVALNGQVVNGRRSSAADYDSYGALATLGSASSGLGFGWSAQASSQTTDYRAGRATSNDRYFVSLNLRPDIDWFAALRAGQETTDVLGVQSRTYNNYGADLRWTPSPRTDASASYDKRYYGAGYNVLLEHRFKRSSLRLTSIRDANDGSNGNPANPGGAGVGVGQPVSLYALFYNQFASIQPDPALRDLLVREFLRAQGLDPNEIIGGGFINSLVTLQRREDLAYTYSGLRDTFTVQAYSSRTQVLDRVSGANNGSNNGINGNGDVKQVGFISTFSHRLTPTASASVTASQLRTLSNGIREATDLRSLVLGLSDQLSRMITGAVNLRYSDFDSTVSPYREAAVSASVTVRF